MKVMVDGKLVYENKEDSARRERTVEVEEREAARTFVFIDCHSIVVAVNSEIQSKTGLLR